MKKEKPLIYEEKEIDLLRILGVLFKYKWFIIITTSCSALGIFLFLIITSSLPPEQSIFPDMYKSVVTILINEKSTNEVITSMLISPGLDSSGSFWGSISSNYSFGELVVKIIRSNSILDIIANEFDIIKRYHINRYHVGMARQKIHEHLSVNYDENTMTVSISYEDYDPEFACKVVNRFLELLEQKYLSLGGSRNIKQKDLLEKKLSEVESEISVLEQKILLFQKNYGVLDVDSLALEQAAMISRFRSQLILKEIEIETYSDFSTIEDPVMKQLKAERDNLIKLIDEIESGFSEYSVVIPSQDDLPDISLEFNHLKRGLNVKEKIYEILIQQYELIKLSLEDEDQIFQVLEPADVPDYKVGPNRTVISIIITLGAFIVSCFLTLIYKTIKNIFNDPESLKKLKGID